jgi:hypothetical protein
MNTGNYLKHDWKCKEDLKKMKFIRVIENKKKPNAGIK